VDLDVVECPCCKCCPGVPPPGPFEIDPHDNNDPIPAIPVNITLWTVLVEDWSWPVLSAEDHLSWPVLSAP
jgi:hypothetical protein